MHRWGRFMSPARSTWAAATGVRWRACAAGTSRHARLVTSSAPPRLAQVVGGRTTAAQPAPGAAVRVCFAVLNPDDLLGDGGLNGLHGALSAFGTRGNHLDGELALVCVDVDDSLETRFKGLRDDSLVNAAGEVKRARAGETQRKFEAERDAALSREKLRQGAAVSVSDGGSAGQGSVSYGSGQLVGTCKKLHHDGRIDVAFSGDSHAFGDLRVPGSGCHLVDEAQDSNEYNAANFGVSQYSYFCPIQQRTVILAESSYTASVPANRVQAYTQYQTITTRATLQTLRRSLALVWPEPLSSADITLRRCDTGATVGINEMATHEVWRPDMVWHGQRSIREMISTREVILGKVEVLIGGRSVPVVDPTCAVVPTMLGRGLAATQRSSQRSSHQTRCTRPPTRRPQTPTSNVDNVETGNTTAQDKKIIVLVRLGVVGMCDFRTGLFHVAFHVALPYGAAYRSGSGGPL